MLLEIWSVLTLHSSETGMMGMTTDAVGEVENLRDGTASVAGWIQREEASWTSSSSCSSVLLGEAPLHV